MPEAGSCVDCPKRTGHNTLLFAEIGANQPDSCTDPKCYAAKIDAHVKQTVAAKPKLVQISTAYGNSRRMAARSFRATSTSKSGRTSRRARMSATGRNTRRASTPPRPSSPKAARRAKPSECAPIPNARSITRRSSNSATHADAAFKAEQEKRRREEALAQATGLRVLKAIGDAVPVRLMKRDLLFLAERLTAMLDERRLSVLIRQHGIGKPKDDAAPAKLLAAFLPKAEESKLGRILVETVILLSMHNQTDAAKILRDAAQAYKVDVDAISATVKQEFAAKEKAKAVKKPIPKPQSKTGKKAAA